jgi:hypothetical protein
MHPCPFTKCPKPRSALDHACGIAACALDDGALRESASRIGDAAIEATCCFLATVRDEKGNPEPLLALSMRMIFETDLAIQIHLDADEKVDAIKFDLQSFDAP